MVVRPPSSCELCTRLTLLMLLLFEDSDDSTDFVFELDFKRFVCLETV